MKTLTGRTRFRAESRGFFVKRTLLILEVEETWEEATYDSAGGQSPVTTVLGWRDGTMADISTSREV